jgi:hypothetical protein
MDFFFSFGGSLQLCLCFYYPESEREPESPPEESFALIQIVI